MLTNVGDPGQWAYSRNLKKKKLCCKVIVKTDGRNSRK
jgi:hypothetical protein